MWTILTCLYLQRHYREELFQLKERSIKRESYCKSSNRKREKSVRKKIHCKNKAALFDCKFKPFSEFHVHRAITHTRSHNHFINLMVNIDLAILTNSRRLKYT